MNAQNKTWLKTLETESSEVWGVDESRAPHSDQPRRSTSAHSRCYISWSERRPTPTAGTADWRVSGWERHFQSLLRRQDGVMKCLTLLLSDVLRCSLLCLKPWRGLCCCSPCLNSSSCDHMTELGALELNLTTKYNWCKRESFVFSKFLCLQWSLLKHVFPLDLCSCIP